MQRDAWRGNHPPVPALDGVHAAVPVSSNPVMLYAGLCQVFRDVDPPPRRAPHGWLLQMSPQWLDDIGGDGRNWTEDELDTVEQARVDHHNYLLHLPGDHWSNEEWKGRQAYLQTVQEKRARLVFEQEQLLRDLRAVRAENARLLLDAYEDARAK